MNKFQHQPSPSAPIGVFDSGVGGLTVARAIAEHLPNEQLLYFGDIAHLPYGDKSSEAIRGYAHSITAFLLSEGCKMVVIACHTASAVAYDSLQERFGDQVMIVNVTDPVLATVARSNISHLGLIATPRTTRSEVYSGRLSLIAPHIKVSEKATPSLASIIEEGMHRDEAAIKAILTYYLNDPLFEDIDGFVLACTHYPIIRHRIAEHFGAGVRLFDATHTIALEVEELLKTANLLASAIVEESYVPHRFLVSDHTTTFQETAELFFGRKVVLQHHVLD